MTEKEMTDIYIIPDKTYKTLDDVLRRHNVSVDFTKFLGGGSFGKVFKAIHLTVGSEAPIACKRIEIPVSGKDRKSKRKRERQLQDIKTELYTLEKLSHPNIIQVLDHFMLIKRHPKTGSTVNRPIYLYIFMHFAPNGTLLGLLHKHGVFDERDCCKFFAQLLSAMDYMHSKNIAHRDLKLSNVLLDDNLDCLVSDFGLSKVYVETEPMGIETFEAKTCCGTPGYMAPEILAGKLDKRSQLSYNPFLADVWALGVMLFQLFNGNIPFPKDLKIGKVIRLMNKKAYDWSSTNPNPPSHGLRMIVKLILDPNPDTRPTVNSLTTNAWIVAELKHEKETQTEGQTDGETTDAPVDKRETVDDKHNKSPKEQSKGKPKNTMNELAVVSNDWHFNPKLNKYYKVFTGHNVDYNEAEFICQTCFTEYSVKNSSLKYVYSLALMSMTDKVMGEAFWVGKYVYSLALMSMTDKVMGEAFWVGVTEHDDRVQWTDTSATVDEKLYYDNLFDEHNCLMCTARTDRCGLLDLTRGSDQHMSASNRWKFNDCDYKYGFICQLNN
ncbi:unnamed protein product [Oppiella nova]|uniref:Protein kinase domain-containing protein n=1 Tax=Oppiella nova TaxID=334625 RepID=A0A7R9LM41_9ACAR|nr:unnamed protein product [Oppiella nova]CAG2165000.1 unnamed protein product [Oppiella nova]